MATDSSHHTRMGREFQEHVRQAMEARYKVGFSKEHPIPIGSPPKEHKFDLVSENQRYLVECKNYSWTETGNVPSAKMAFLCQAIFYLMLAPDDKRKFLVLRKATSPKKDETLAEYYVRRYRHLLGPVAVLELDVRTKELIELA